MIGAVLYALAAMAGPGPEPVEQLANEFAVVSHKAVESEQAEEMHAAYLPYY